MEISSFGWVPLKRRENFPARLASRIAFVSFVFPLYFEPKTSKFNQIAFVFLLYFDQNYMESPLYFFCICLCHCLRFSPCLCKSLFFIISYFPGFHSFTNMSRGKILSKSFGLEELFRNISNDFSKRFSGQKSSSHAHKASGTACFCVRKASGTGHSRKYYHFPEHEAGRVRRISVK